MYAMNKKKLRLALLGRDVSKSRSEEIHTFILNGFGVEVAYERISVMPFEFDNAMRYLLGDFDGFNVTIPYKREVMGRDREGIPRCFVLNWNNRIRR